MDIFVAIGKGNLAKVKEALKANPALVKNIDEDSNTPLIVAATLGELEIVNHIIQVIQENFAEKANDLINFTPEGGNSALESAYSMLYEPDEECDLDPQVFSNIAEALEAAGAERSEDLEGYIISMSAITELVVNSLEELEDLVTSTQAYGNQTNLEEYEIIVEGYNPETDQWEKLNQGYSSDGSDSDSSFGGFS